MRAIIKRAFEPVGRLIDIPNELKPLQQAVGGYLEAVTLASDLAILCDEEGRLKGKIHNCTICGYEFVGTILAVGVSGEEFADVPITLEQWERMVTGTGGEDA